jgi:hypothetical protein
MSAGRTWRTLLAANETYDRMWEWLVLALQSGGEWPTAAAVCSAHRPNCAAFFSGGKLSDGKHPAWNECRRVSDDGHHHVGGYQYTHRCNRPFYEHRPHLDHPERTLSLVSPPGRCPWAADWMMLSTTPALSRQSLLVPRERK